MRLKHRKLNPCSCNVMNSSAMPKWLGVSHAESQRIPVVFKTFFEYSTYRNCVLLMFSELVNAQTLSRYALWWFFYSEQLHFLGTLSKPIPMADHMPKSLRGNTPHQTATGSRWWKGRKPMYPTMKARVLACIGWEERQLFSHIAPGNYPLREGVLNY